MAETPPRVIAHYEGPAGTGEGRMTPFRVGDLVRETKSGHEGRIVYLGRDYAYVEKSNAGENGTPIDRLELVEEASS